MKIDCVNTGRKIHDMRVASGMTISDIQMVCDVSSTAVTKWQNGKSLPSLENLVKLASLMQCKIDDLIAVS